jgi:hypothetical protein
MQALDLPGLLTQHAVVSRCMPGQVHADGGRNFHNELFTFCGIFEQIVCLAALVACDKGN